MREDHPRFVELGAEVLAIAPETRDSARAFHDRNPMPFPLVYDEEHDVFDRYDVVRALASLGQRPALFVVDGEGIVRFNHVGTQQWQIPGNDEVLEVVRGLAERR